MKELLSSCFLYTVIPIKIKISYLFIYKLSLSSPSSLTGIQFSVEHGHGDAVIGHPHKVSGPTKLRTLDVMFVCVGGMVSMPHTHTIVLVAQQHSRPYILICVASRTLRSLQRRLVRLPNDPLPLPIRAEISSSINAFCNIVLPKCVNLSVTFSGLVSMVMVGAV